MQHVIIISQVIYEQMYKLTRIVDLLPELANSDPMDMDDEHPKAKAAASIRQTLERVLIVVLNCGEPSMFLRRRPTKARFFVNPDTGALEADEAGSGTERTYRFPGKDVHEAWRFSMDGFSGLTHKDF